MRFMLMMHAPRGTGDYQVSQWSPEDFKAHIAFMHQFNKELTEAGELRRRRRAGAARRGEGGARGEGRRARGDRRPLSRGQGVPGRLLDRRGGPPERAYEIAAKASAAPGPGGAPLDMPIEVRQVMSGLRRTRERRSPRHPPLGHLLRDLAPQVLGAVARRHGDFAAAEDAVQEALIAAAAQWPRDGVPSNPRGWLLSGRDPAPDRSPAERDRHDANARRPWPASALRGLPSCRRT